MGALRRRVRKDAGARRRMGAKLREALQRQYKHHPGWEVASEAAGPADFSCPHNLVMSSHALDDELAPSLVPDDETGVRR